MLSTGMLSTVGQIQFNQLAAGWIRGIFGLSRDYITVIAFVKDEIHC